VVAEETDMADPFNGLRDYLKGRYADSIVLTFAQIESLNGTPLSDAARASVEWWSGGRSTDGADVPTRAWTTAERTAVANIGAQTVRFDRVAS
jgi:hypothetical protein